MVEYAWLKYRPNTCYEKFGVYPFQEMVINDKNKEGFEKLLQSKGLQFTTTGNIPKVSKVRNF